ncbi:helix-turn-helix domain-containing protein [Amycolatopsis sp. WAC 04197]|uniref:AlbA family DNA-binding domain-containing protein n=1 Tax=Amycolatopsis sp. WAC 04197 TaxID=2203199 RepID=UPI001315A8F1|nr:ATP-binding protein [Amycolatopsis sp. WAC 04197]
MSVDVPLGELLRYSNLRARVKFHQLGLSDPGGIGDFVDGSVSGGDVRLLELEDVSFFSLARHFAVEFERSSRREVVFLVVHFENGRRHEDIELLFERDGTVLVSFTLDGGNPRGLEHAREHAEETFVSAGAVVRWLEHCPADEEVDQDYWSVGLSVTDLKVTVGALCAAVKALRPVLCTFRGESGPDRRGEFKRRVLEGRFAEILGTAESDWLECKAKLQIGGPDGNDKLTKAVCGLANGHRAGLLVVGLKTVPVDGRDVVAEVTPVLARAHTAERYWKIVDDHVEPVVRGLEIDVVPVNGGVLVVLSVPAQPEHTKPFVVTKNGGTLLFQRRGDHTVQLTSAEVRTLLAQGWGR